MAEPAEYVVRAAVRAATAYGGDPRGAIQVQDIFTAAARQIVRYDTHASSYQKLTIDPDGKRSLPPN